MPARTTTELYQTKPRIVLNRSDLPGLGPVTRLMVKRARVAGQTQVKPQRIVGAPRVNLVVKQKKYGSIAETKIVAKSTNNKLLDFVVNIPSVDGDARRAATAVATGHGSGGGAAAAAAADDERESMIRVRVVGCRCVKFVYQQKQ